MVDRETTNGKPERLRDAARAIAPRVVAWRRHLHANPELSFREHASARFVWEQLHDLPGVELLEPCKTSVVARIRRGTGGPVIALRADLDALPIQEEGTAPYRSRVDGAMHACGHDGHTAMLLGAAEILAGEPFEGEVRLLFQHAEETPPGGARDLIAAGLLDGVTVAVGCHLWTQLPTGRVAIVPGRMMAGNDEFTITVRGSGGHAAAPHETVDPIAIGAEITTAINHLVARRTSAHDSLVVSVTRFHAGNATNVIPAEAELSGTIRYLDTAVRDATIAGIERLAAGIADAYGATAGLEVRPGYIPVVNDPVVTERVEAIARATLGDEAVTTIPPTMGAEDFGAMLAVVPGTYMFLGTRNEAVGSHFPHHHPRFEIDEASLEQGVVLMSAVALELLDPGP